MKKIYLPLFCIIFFSCTVKIHYIGQSSAPTKHIDVYILESSIKKSYELIGEGYLNKLARPDKIQLIAEETARKKGADAVIISNYFIPNTGQSINTIYRTDSVAKAVITTGNTTISTLNSSGYRILFVKYNK